MCMDSTCLYFLNESEEANMYLCEWVQSLSCTLNNCIAHDTCLVISGSAARKLCIELLKACVRSTCLTHQSCLFAQQTLVCMNYSNKSMVVVCFNDCILFKRKHILFKFECPTKCQSVCFTIMHRHEAAYK